jgi:hypothetical protein
MACALLTNGRWQTLPVSHAHSWRWYRAHPAWLLAAVQRQKMAWQPPVQAQPEAAAPGPPVRAVRATARLEPADEPAAARPAAARPAAARPAAARPAAARPTAELAQAASKRRTATRRCSPACSLKAAASPASSTRTASMSKPPTAGTIARCRSRTAQQVRPSLRNWEPSRRRTAHPAYFPCCPARRSTYPRRSASQACANSSRLGAVWASPARGALGRRDRA